MKAIKNKPREYDIFRWEGKITNELKTILVNNGFDKTSLIYKELKQNNIIEGRYLIFDRGYYNIMPEKEFNEQFKIVQCK